MTASVLASPIPSRHVELSALNSHARSGIKVPRLITALCTTLLGAITASAQISLSTAVDLALKDNPKVLIAQADVDKARALLNESRDVYIPSLIAGSGLGYSYGFPLGTPTIFNMTSQSLLFNYSQRDYIRAARAGLEAANFALRDVRLQVEEDVAVTYLSLDRAQQRKLALTAEAEFATNLVTIVQQRLDAGQENAVELLRGRRTAAQIRLQHIQLDDEIASYTDHLGRLCGLSTTQLVTVSDSIPALGSPDRAPDLATPNSPAISSALANAEAKRHQAFGDSRYLYRPQVAFGAQYSRFSNINNYDAYYPGFKNSTLNAIAVGIQIQVPLFDRVHRDRASASLADAIHAEQEVRVASTQFLEGRLKLNHAANELSARSDLAVLDREIAQNQLDVVLLQLQSSSSDNGPLMTPKDEQNARIQERQRYIDLIEADFQLRQTQINLLRQNGQLEDWLKSASRSPSVPPSVTAR